MVTLGTLILNTTIVILHNFLSRTSPPATTTRAIHHHDELTIRELVPKHGYQLEEHEVQTEDGYLLTMFRIPGQRRKEGNSSTCGRPVLLMHGILSSAQDYIILGPERSVAYNLVDNGYDVWLGNARGNRYSRKHVRLHPDSSIFWQFSFHQMGYYDLPALIDYITKITRQPSIFYAGHSQGTTSMFVMASERPEVIRKIKLFVALAPVVYTASMPALMAQLMATFYHQVNWAMHSLELYEIFGHSDILARTLRLLCVENIYYRRLCEVIMTTHLGYNNDTNVDILSRVFSSFPAGCSLHQIMHFVQNKLSDQFNKYDHGPEKNMQIYGQDYPPRYRVRTRLPTAIIYSNNDWLSTETDVDRISNQLKNLKYKYKMPGTYNHADYIFGRDGTKIVSDKILEWFKEQ